MSQFGVSTCGSIRTECATARGPSVHESAERLVPNACVRLFFASRNEIKLKSNSATGTADAVAKRIFASTTERNPFHPCDRAPDFSDCLNIPLSPSRANRALRNTVQCRFAVLTRRTSRAIANHPANQFFAFSAA